MLNTLDPCNACMEWLRKIAEVNPDCKVITFNDNKMTPRAIRNSAQ